ncbi:galactose-1-phosphate uridylyltransferase [Catellatospora sp. TT07R-123]|uniref:galactose-1-phosphate uridylyltransferase n=1 Tax=Catellatospora sp. TT07R-123 TaxID=2733863 RepID=UPI001B085B2F|nr:galactose-1-phosphate uridylyltransferase [Catellatospora sp. TT07R-123]GHJ46023.1 galactose-1-phosphate uridylyltransferase [Catellatospora sp. TT07R-123]
MKRTSITMADGRELIYFDERDDAVRATVDDRELPPPPAPAQLRFDALTDEWVAVAAHRQGRPLLPSTAECPLCPSTGGFRTEVPADDYDVVVFENRFPSFSGESGRCEVVCFSPRHDASFKELPVSRVRTVLAVLADRTAELSALGGVEQVFCFENRGVEIGVTLHHPHGQIYGYPYVTPVTRRYLDAARRHRDLGTGTNLYADLLAAERSSGERVVAANEFWTAFVPYAARWPYEIHIAPNRQVPDLAALTETELDACAPLWSEVARRLDGLFDLPMPYVAGWHQAPVRTDRELGYLHLRIFSSRRAPGKLKYLAGSESSMGAWVNDIAPEQAAAALRAVTL